MKATKNINSVHGNETLIIRTFHQWFGQFPSEDPSPEKSPPSGQPCSVNVQFLEKVIEKNLN